MLFRSAFLRRIRYKVFAESPSPDDYARIWAAACAERGVVFDRGLVDRVLAECYRPRRIPLRACHPRDLIDQALSLAQYRGETTRLTFTLLAAACDSYFVDDAES